MVAILFASFCEFNCVFGYFGMKPIKNHVLFFFILFYFILAIDTNIGYDDNLLVLSHNLSSYTKTIAIKSGGYGVIFILFLIIISLYVSS